LDKQTVLVLDFGGHNHSAAREIRGLNVYCEVVKSDITLEEIKVKNPIGLVLAGGESVILNPAIADSGIPVFSSGNLKEFLFEKCGAKGDWTMKRFAGEYTANIRKHTGGKKVLCALSGGVDSSVCAALLSKAIGKNLTCIFVDTGLMRKNEAAEVGKFFSHGFEMNFILVNAAGRFLAKLAGVTDPERKRKIIGEEFIRVFEDESKKIGEVDYLVQGTIYPDIIESAAVKSHHNVGGLPSVVKFKEIIEPLRLLFKDEVRRLGAEVGLSKELYTRQPFPGPGLAVRCIGAVTFERLEILRDADYIFRSEIAAAGLEGELSQYFAVLTDMKSVGVRDGKRTYEYTVGLRAVKTVDYMTADWAEIPYAVLRKVSARITSEVAGVNRVVLDITAKPPSTIGWE